MVLSGELRIAIDIGGTFTDCVVINGLGAQVSAKALTTPSDPSIGVIDALEIAASLSGTTIDQLLKRTISFVHGTTVGTNALTTRRGARTGLLMTRGHEQAILIGRVRQKITGLSEREKTHVTHLTKATPAIVGIEDIRGITERVDASGNVVVPLDLAQAKLAIDDLVASGIEALAICLLWSFLYPLHERLLADLVRAKYPGLFMSLSSQIAPRMGEYERCVSTVFNSYIGPLVGDYINRLERKLKDLGMPSSLLVIQSNGGLGTAKSVLGRPLLIVDSGPAGGVLGAKYSASQIAQGNILCADIGGTTFDVGLVFEDRIQMDPAPTIDKYAYLIPKIFVKSIGAGGGSIVWLDQGGSLRVGPQSAGSAPGPVAYGRGGTDPTVTDALVVLGFLDPDHLLGRTVKLDSQAATAALSDLGRKLNMSAVETAAAVLQISNAQMADLARKVTVERGIDPRDFVLFTYGGAGPLFGAFIAREIGAKFTYVPAESGVFSAFGMLTADIALQEEQSANLRSPLSETDVGYANRILADLEQRVIDRFRSTDLPVEQVRIYRSVDMRFSMQVHELNVDVPALVLSQNDLQELAVAFTRKYEATYGPDSAYTGAGFEYVTFKVIGVLENSRPILECTDPNPVAAEASVTGQRRVYFPGEGYVDAAIHDGARLRAGGHLAGPAIIQRASDTIVLPPGSKANVDARGGLTIVWHEQERDRKQAASGAAEPHGSARCLVSDRVDVVTFEVLRHRLWEINDEMGIIAARISGSPAVYESGDFNTALLTAEGKGLFTGVYIIRQAAALDVVVQSVIARFGPDVKDGDMFLLNDPWCGALHAMDYAVVAPVFWEGVIVAWTGIVMHEMDVGGPVPGSWTVGAEDAYQECPLMPPIKIVDGGTFKKEIEALYLRNTRTPDINALNLRAKIAAQLTTRKRLHDIIRQYGKDTFMAVQLQISDYVRTSVRKRLSGLPDGTWYGNAIIDHDGNENRLYRIRLALTKHGEELILDFTGTSAQAKGPINCAYSGLVGGVTQVLFPLLCFDIPWSHGALTDCIRIISAEGTVNNCTFPAATSMSTVNAATATGNAVWEAMSRMYSCSEELGDEVVAMGYGGMNLGLLSGQRSNGKNFINMFTDSVGGGGATAKRDGVNTCGSLYAPSYGIPNVERIEGLLPVLYVYRKQRGETAGAGMKRGGVGIEYMIVPHGTGSNINAVYFATGCNHLIAKGLNGGLPGSVQQNLILRDAAVKDMFRDGVVPSAWADVARGSTDVQQAKSRAIIRPGDAWVNFCCGGGGYGDPLKREPGEAATDVANGMCTADEIERLYGVVLASDAGVDVEATGSCRRRILGARLEGGVRLGPDWKPGARFDGGLLFRYGELLAVKIGEAGPVTGCTQCNFVLGPATEDPRQRALMVEARITDLSPLNAYGRVDEVVVRQYCCPGCATMFSSDVQLREDDPRTPEMHLSFENIGRDARSSPKDSS